VGEISGIARPYSSVSKCANGLGNLPLEEYLYRDCNESFLQEARYTMSGLPVIAFFSMIDHTCTTVDTIIVVAMGRCTVYFAECGILITYILRNFDAECSANYLFEFRITRNTVSRYARQTRSS